MPNKKEHLVLGASAALIAEAFRQYAQARPSLENLLLAAFGGAVGSLLPDAIEPPTHPNHRGPFHSSASLLMSSLGAKAVYEHSPPGCALALGAFVGFSSHLVADATTPKGIPCMPRWPPLSGPKRRRSRKAARRRSV
jgi:membrane-bound metal-dependent hydrolase YbcI (DUF457 family)